VTARRELLVAVVLDLVGALLVLLAASRPWISYLVPAAAPLPSRAGSLPGSAVATVQPFAFLAVAGVAALPATRRWGRLAVGVLVALAGTAVVAYSVRAFASPEPAAAARGVFAPDLQTTLWPVVSVVGGLLLVLAGLLVVVRGRGWASMSSRYDAPSARPAKPASQEAALWEALDRGEDPTRRRPDAAD
jgi:uncharacterized membrane protein (TIGR02234 family)